MKRFTPHVAGITIPFPGPRPAGPGAARTERGVDRGPHAELHAVQQRRRGEDPRHRHRSRTPARRPLPALPGAGAQLAGPHLHLRLPRRRFVPAVRADLQRPPPRLRRLFPLPAARQLCGDQRRPARRRAGDHLSRVPALRDAQQLRGPAALAPRGARRVLQHVPGRQERGPDRAAGRRARPLAAAALPDPAHHPFHGGRALAGVQRVVAARGVLRRVLGTGPLSDLRQPGAPPAGFGVSPAGAGRHAAGPALRQDVRQRSRHPRARAAHVRAEAPVQFRPRSHPAGGEPRLGSEADGPGRRALPPREPARQPRATTIAPRPRSTSAPRWPCSRTTPPLSPASASSPSGPSARPRRAPSTRRPRSSRRTTSSCSTSTPRT